MAKNNKNKNKQVNNQPVVENKEVKATPVETKEAPKDNKKVNKPTPRAAVENVDVPKDATGKVEEVKVEEVKPVEKTQPNFSVAKPNIDSLVSMLGDDEVMDANHSAIFLDVLERRVSKMKPNQPLTIQLEQALDYNLAWRTVCMSIQTFARKRELNMLVPSDETLVQGMIDMYASMGVALEAHPNDNNPKQMVLEFKEDDIAPETKEAAKAEIEVATKPNRHQPVSEAEMDPLNWKTDDDARKAILEDIKVTNESPSNKFLRILGKIRTYRENIETDPEKKKHWATVSLGELAKDYVELIPKKGIIAIKGIMSSALGSMKLGQTMIFAHSILKKNMSALSDEEIRDLLKAFIEISHEDASQPIEQDPAVVKGILAPTRDTFVRIALQKPAEGESLDFFKRILNPFWQVYKDEVGSKVLENGSENPDFPLKSANKMIEIRNLYVDSKSRFPLYTSEDFKAVVGA